jgi:hypothetical protein
MFAKVQNILLSFTIQNLGIRNRGGELIECLMLDAVEMRKDMTKFFLRFGKIKRRFSKLKLSFDLLKRCLAKIKTGSL